MSLNIHFLPYLSNSRLSPTHLSVCLQSKQKCKTHYDTPMSTAALLVSRSVYSSYIHGLVTHAAVAVTMRGISNTTGTACHLNAALMVWRHCLGPLGENDHHYLLSTKDDASDDTLLLPVLLQRFLQELGDESATATPVDPSELYQALASARGRRLLQAEDLGDAVTALSRLLQTAAASSSAWSDLQTEWLESGRVQSVLTGTKRGYKSRRKELKERSLSNPLLLQLVADDDDDHHLLLDVTTALRRHFLQELVVQDYQWPETRISDCSTVGHWKTTRRQYLRQLPRIFMLHLERFRLVDHGRRNKRLEPIDQKQHQCVNVPETLDMSEYLQQQQSDNEQQPQSSSAATAPNSTRTLFHLRGGILHVSDESSNDENEEDGHYVAVVCGKDSNEWYLVDDERVTSVPLAQVLRWLGGDWYNAAYGSESATSYLRGVLLIYHCDDDPLLVEKLVELRIKNDETSNNNGFENQWVGRRLRIQWKGGTFYTGRVTAYDAATGKHTVTYDDGDVRHYKLSKKTVEWIGSDDNQDSDDSSSSSSSDSE